MSGWRMPAFPRAALGCVFALMVAGSVPAAWPGQAAATGGLPLQAQFSATATEFGVPTAVLLAVGYEESRWEMHGDLPSVAGGFGPMHLTDTAVVGRGDGQFDGDARGAAESPVQSELLDTGGPPPREHEATPDTLPAAAALLGVTPDSLRREPEQNLRGGAALLARYQREVTGDLSTDPGRWYPAVARYSGPPDAATARAFADDVFSLIRDGVARTTYEGQQVRLAADPDIRPDRAAVARLGLPEAGPGAAAAECPRTLACDYLPAAYAQTDPTDKTSYGNYDLADRPRDGDAVRYIVIHDTEGSYDVTLQSFADPTFGASAHYLIRSADGHVTQSVPTRDVAWHAGNWYVNSHAIGIEHEGVAVDGGAWYTEALYRSSARLVKYLARRYHIPLDRAHILGHDNVPAPTGAYLNAMHWDPGPYWDWDHYMELLGRPSPSPGATHSRMVTIAPYYGTNRPPLTDCGPDPCLVLPNQPASFVYLYTEPATGAPLIGDPAVRPGAGTTQIDDLRDKASSGQRFVVAEQRAGWTAIWFGGAKAWYPDPDGTNSTPVQGRIVRPRTGLASIPVYGRAYPEAAAYPPFISAQPVAALPYTIPAGQAYPAGDPVTADYFYSTTVDGSAPGNRTVVRGSERYYAIEFNHRRAFVNAADVTVGFA